MPVEAATNLPPGTVVKAKRPNTGHSHSRIGLRVATHTTEARVPIGRQGTGWDLDTQKKAVEIIEYYCEDLCRTPMLEPHRNKKICHALPQFPCFSFAPPGPSDLLNILYLPRPRSDWTGARCYKHALQEAVSRASTIESVSSGPRSLKTKSGRAKTTMLFI